MCERKVRNLIYFFLVILYILATNVNNTKCYEIDPLTICVIKFIMCKIKVTNFIFIVFLLFYFH